MSAKMAGAGTVEHSSGLKCLTAHTAPIAILGQWLFQLNLGKPYICVVPHRHGKEFSVATFMPLYPCLRPERALLVRLDEWL
jgi:hypothetical protein